MKPPGKGNVFLPRRAPWLTIGTAVALAGAEMLVLGIGLAWPWPVPLPAVAIPLVLVCVGLAVHAWQVRLPGFLFAAGLAGNLVATLLVLGHNRLLTGQRWWVPLLQANAIAFGAAALLGLAARHRLFGPPVGRALVRLQVGLGFLAAGILILAALGALLLQPGALPALVSAVGGTAGWLALGLPALAGLWYARLYAPGRVTALAGAVLLAVGVLAASTAAPWDQRRWLSYHILTAAWAALAVGMLAHGTRAGGEFQAVLLADGPALSWVVLLGGLVLVLGLRGARGDVLGPAPSIAALLFVSGLAADLALGRRREGWAFIAGLPLQLAVALFVWSRRQPGDPQGDGIVLAQAVLVTVEVCTLAWLAAGRRLRPAGAPGASPLLSTQVVAGLAGNLALLVPAAALLIWFPGQASPIITHVGGPAGWAALLLGVIAAGWHARRMRTPPTVHAGCGLGLALGVLLACSTVALTDNYWLGYHVLMGACAALGLAVLAAGWRAGRRSIGGAPPAAVQAWVAALDVLVAGLALRVLTRDPLGPWPPAVGLLLGALMAGALALWTGRQSFVWVGGLLLVGVAVSFGAAADIQRSPDWAALILLGQALAATVCSAAGSVVRRRRPGRLPRGDALPFSYVATLLSLLGVVLLGALGEAGALAELSVPSPGPLGWAALGGVVLALVAALWDPDALFPLAGLYAAALAALGFILSALPPAWAGPDVPALAAFVTLTTVFWRTSPAWQRLGRRLGIPHRLGGWPRAWFGPTQALLGGTAVFLSVLLCLSHAGQSERFAGPVAICLLLPGALLAVGRTRPRAQNAVLILAALLAAEWAWVGL